MSQSQPLTTKQALSRARKALKQGNIETALNFYSAILQAQPDHPVAKKAVRKLQKKYSINQARTGHRTDPPQTQSDVLLELYNSGEMFATEQACREILQSYPDSLLVINILGAALKGLGNLDEAVIAFDLAIQLDSAHSESYNNRGVILQDLRRLDAAIADFSKALTLDPDYSSAHGNLGYALLQKGQAGDAFGCFRRAVALAPGNESFWTGYATSLAGFSFTAVDDNFVKELSYLLDCPSIQPAAIARPILSVIWQYPDFVEIFNLVNSGKAAAGISFLDFAQRLSTLELLLKIMLLCPVFDLEIERMLTILRRSMLESTSLRTGDDPIRPFEVALALQCFTNEYSFAESREEKSLIDDLLQKMSVLVENDRDIPAFLITTVAAYRPLFRLPWARQLSEQEWVAELQELKRRQFTEPLKELDLRSQVPCLTPIENTVSLSVREQYEENPYPRWIRTGLSSIATPVDKVLLAALPHLDLGSYSAPEKTQILVAGCGTGQHALMTAAKISDASVLAVDLSLSSISYAMRKTQELGIGNIEYGQADIMELASIGRQFDLIESIGVLHHLGDPVGGWRVLTKLLRPGGFMKIGLYSELAREDVAACQALITDQGYTSSATDIRRCRQAIIALSAAGNKDVAEIFDKNDFFSISECRDLLFHVQEHRFTVPQIEKALRELELDFLGFEISERAVLSNFQQAHPQNSDLSSLQLWHQFEQQNPTTFSGMYEFWCRKN